MFLDQLGELPFLWQHRARLLHGLAAASSVSSFPITVSPFRFGIRVVGSSAAMLILFRSLLCQHRRDIVLLTFVLMSLVPAMIDAQHAAEYRGAAQIVDRQVRAPLVFIFEERKALTLAGFFVADEVHMYRFAVLRENRNDVAFGQLIWKAADVDVCGVAVVGMPRCFGRAGVEMSVVSL